MGDVETTPQVTEEQFRSAVLARLTSIEGKVDALRAYVEQIEKEAHEAMGGLTDPDNMMKMAGQFLGVKP